MPLTCTYCEGRLLTNPTFSPFSVIPEALSKSVYIAYAAHALALEAGSALSWSISTSMASELHHYLNSRSLMHRLSSSDDFFFGEAGGGGTQRIMNVGRMTPATPIFAYRWMVNNNILAPTHLQTITNLLQWFRENAIHFYGASTYQNVNDHWGYPSQPSVYSVISGTIRASESAPDNWTAGCHGTAGTIKSLLKSVNIPAEVIFTCGHSQLYFPSIDLYLDHGDNPYNNNVKTNAAKSVADLLISPTQYTTWFSATPDNITPGDPLCDNIGKGTDSF